MTQKKRATKMSDVKTNGKVESDLDSVVIPLGIIKVDTRFNVRSQMDGENNTQFSDLSPRAAQKISELAQSIKKNGQITPVVVRQVGAKYELIAGFRRYAACKVNGAASILAQVRNLSDEQADIVNMIENGQRKDLEPFEYATKASQMMKDHSLTEAQLATKIGGSASYLGNLVRCRRNLCKEILAAWANPELASHSVCTMKNLLVWQSLKTNGEQVAAFESACTEKDIQPGETAEEAEAKEPKPMARKFVTIIAALDKAKDYASKATGPELAYAKGVVNALEWVANKSEAISGVVEKDAPKAPKKRGRPAGVPNEANQNGVASA